MVTKSPVSRRRATPLQRLLLVDGAGVEGLGDAASSSSMSALPSFPPVPPRFRVWKAAHCFRAGAAMASATMMAVTSFMALDGDMELQGHGIDDPVEDAAHNDGERPPEHGAPAQHGLPDDEAGQAR